MGKALEFNEERCMHMIAAIITWIIAFYFYCKARCKRNKRLKKGGALLDDNVKNYQSFDDNVRDEHRENDNTSFCSSSSDSSVNYEELNIGNDVARPITVCSLTFLGGLDELTYFPSLLIGKTFTPLELSLGAMIACVLIIIMISSILSTCRPILNWMDSIPLYYIIGLLAIFLSADTVLDYVNI